MTRRRAVVQGVLTMSAIACGLAAFSTSIAAPTTAPATLRPTTRPNAFAPFTYFETNCARCHGPYGSAYGEAFGRHLNDAQLAKVIDDMAFGPGNAPVEAPQLQVLVDYHKAMIAKTPFVTVTAIEPTPDGQSKLTGEITPRATLQVNGLPATIDGHTWTLISPAATQYDLTASLNDKPTSLRVTPP